MTDTRDEGYCKRCGREITPADPAPHCAQCAVEVADGHLSAPAKMEASAPSAQARHDLLVKLRRFGTPVLAAFLTTVLLVQTPTLLGAFASPRPVHNGDVATDATGDRCVGNLWLIAESVAERRPLDKSLRCPASDRPYAESTEGGVIAVSCPSPTLHGAKSLSVRSDALVPAVR